MEINRHKSTLNIHRIKAHSIQSFLASISVSFLFDSIIARWRKQSIYTSIYVPTNSMSGFSFFFSSSSSKPCRRFNYLECFY
jgi:hypothetical protein